MGETITVDGTEIWVEQRGAGPDVLLRAGLGDPVEAWEAQLDGLSGRYRVTALDNRGSGRTPLAEEPLSVPLMAEDAAAVMGALGIPAAHVLGFSGGAAIAQELALARPELVRSLVLVGAFARPDAHFASMISSWRSMVQTATSERAVLEAFFLWVYTPRAHADGTVERLIDETLAFPHPQSAAAFLAQLDVFGAHDALDRLPAIAAPTLVLTGGADMIAPERFGRAVAEAIPGARFELMPGEAHQPFQEVPELFNARVDAFWQGVEPARPRPRRLRSRTGV